MAEKERPKKQMKRVKRRRKPLLFKTLNARVSFVVIATVILVVGSALYGTQEIWSRADNAALRLIGVTGLLIVAALLLMLVVADILITRKIRRMCHVIREVVAGDVQEESLPYGLGELDGITSMFDRLVEDLEKSVDEQDVRVRQRTSLLEISKGMTEIEKARTEALLSSIGEGVVATDKKGTVTFFNEKAAEAMWWEPKKAVGVHVSSVFHLETEDEEVISEDKWPTRYAIEDGETIETDAPAKPFYLRSRNKERIPIQMTISPIMLNEGIAGALIIFRDITEEVEFDNRKSEFISIASHQLRSPMSAMKWMSDMLRRGDLGEMNAKQQEWADKIYIASEQMVELVNVLLNISRLESGMKMSPKETDPAKFLDEVMKSTKPLLQEKKQEFSYKGKSMPRVIFDPIMITEVLKNYISNASKYSPEGATIVIKGETKDSSIHISVTDQGIGVPKSSEKQMFNKFFRAENAMEKQVKGTGLGLYYCKSAVEAHGGKVGFDSTEGKGSTFWFTLPILGPQKKE